MLRLFALFVLSIVVGSPAIAQSTATYFFRAQIGPDPATDTTAGSGLVDLRISVLNDGQGMPQSASLSYRLNIETAGSTRYTDLKIRRAASDPSEPEVLDLGLVPFQYASMGELTRQTQVTADNPALATIANELVANPTNFSLTLYSADSFDPVSDGPIQAAQRAVVMSVADGAAYVPQEEAPPEQDPAAEGSAGDGATANPALEADPGAMVISAAMIIATRDAQGAVDSGRVTMQITSQSAESRTITSLGILRAAAGMPGEEVFDVLPLAGLDTILMQAPNDVAELTFEVPSNEGAGYQALSEWLASPQSFAVQMTTDVDSGYVVRGQWSPSERMDFPVVATPDKVIPMPDCFEGYGAGTVSLFIIRHSNGFVRAGLLQNDFSYEITGGATLTALHIKGAPANGVGGVAIPTSFETGSGDLYVDSGVGNIFGTDLIAWSSGPTAWLPTIESIFRNPDEYYIELLTERYPTGALRAQLQAPSDALPNIERVKPVIDDDSVVTVAPGSLISITGTNLTKTIWTHGTWVWIDYPRYINGAGAQADGQLFPLLVAAPWEFFAQVPLEMPPGTHQLVTDSPNGMSNPVSLVVLEHSPALLVGPNGGYILKLSDYTWISADNPASPGDMLMIYSNGLGKTSPPLVTGARPPSDQTLHTAPVTIRVGDQSVAAISSVAGAGNIGLYATTFELPNVGSGLQELVLEIGGSLSNAVLLPVQ